jgi:hypothetical protein
MAVLYVALMDDPCDIARSLACFRSNAYEQMKVHGVSEMTRVLRFDKTSIEMNKGTTKRPLFHV